MSPIHGHHQIINQSPSSQLDILGVLLPAFDEGGNQEEQCIVVENRAEFVIQGGGVGGAEITQGWVHGANQEGQDENIRCYSQVLQAQQIVLREGFRLRHVQHGWPKTYAEEWIREGEWNSSSH